MTASHFSDFLISPPLLKAIDDLGFNSPTPIQYEAIPLLLQGHDLIGRAQTGTGKTLAFAIPVIEKLKPQHSGVQALVICPTRELVQQVAEEFRKLLKYCQEIKVQTIYGGAPIQEQLKALKKNPQIVVGTPGRLLDLMRRKSLKLSQVHTLILDEADEMLDMGFREDIDLILAETPTSRQTVLFSATMTPEILQLMKQYQREAIRVDVTATRQSAPQITQYVYEMREGQKKEALVRLVAMYDVKLAVVFCNTKMKVDSLVQFLKTSGYSADALHGDLSQKMREKVMATFRAGGIRILVATDIAGRGIDVRNIEAVFNYDLPHDDEDYVHRIGRTGRAGASGLAFTFITPGEYHILRRIERRGEVSIIRRKVPELQELETVLRERKARSLAELMGSDGLAHYRKQVEELAKETGYAALDIAAALLKNWFGNHIEKFNPNEKFTDFTAKKKDKFQRKKDNRKPAQARHTVLQGRSRKRSGSRSAGRSLEKMLTKPV